MATTYDVLMEFNVLFHNYVNKFLSEIKSQTIDVGGENIEISAIPSAWLSEIIAKGAALAKLISNNSEISHYGTQVSESTNAINILKSSYPEKDNQVYVHSSSIQPLTMLLDLISNSAHYAAEDTIKAVGSIKGCKVKEFDKSNIKAISAWCSGVTGSPATVIINKKDGKPYIEKLKIGNTTFIKKYANSIVEHLGCHGVEPSFSTEGDEIHMGVDYHDSGPPGYTPGSIYRKAGVTERLESMGFKCNVGDAPNTPQDKASTVVCNISDISEENIQMLSIFFSLLYNGDTYGINHNPKLASNPKLATAMIKDGVWQYAEKLKNKFGENVYQYDLKNEKLSQWKTNVVDPWLSGIEKKKEEDTKAEFDKKYTNNPLYNEIKLLHMLRDNHHMIEEKYGISHGKASMEGMKAIVQNGKQAQALLTKLKMGSVQEYIDKIQYYIDKGQAVDISNPSDLLGHELHSYIVHKLHSEGSYGGCTTADNIYDVSAGAMTYCEGVLQGTSAKAPSTNNWTHVASPNMFNVKIGEDEFDTEQYSFIIQPEVNSQMWKNLILDYLKGKGWKCSSDGKCKIITDDLGIVRRMALFLSNLKGADDSIGEECAKKAIELSDLAADALNESDGVLAFTKPTMYKDKKEWIDACAQTGINPPQKVIVEEFKSTYEAYYQTVQKLLYNSNPFTWTVKQVYSAISQLYPDVKQPATLIVLNTLVQEGKVDKVGEEHYKWHYEAVPGEPPKTEVKVESKEPEKITGKKIFYEYIKNIAEVNVSCACSINNLKGKLSIPMAAYCAGIKAYYSKDNKIKPTMLINDVKGINGHHNLGMDTEVTFSSIGNMLYLNLPDSMLIPEIEYILTKKIGFQKDKESFNFYTDDMNAMTHAAEFLSNLSGWVNIPKSCQQKAIDHAFASIHNEIGDFIEPFTAEQWANFCAGAKPEDKKEVIKITEDSPYLKEPWLLEGKTYQELKYTGLYDLPIGKQIAQCFGSKISKYMGTVYPINPNKFKDISKENVKVIWTECYNEVMGIKPEAEKTKNDIAAKYQAIVDSKQKSYEIASKKFLDHTQQWKDEQTKKEQYKKLSIVSQDAIHAYMAQALAQGQLLGGSYESILKNVQEMVIKQFPKLTPLMVKLQLELEKKQMEKFGELFTAETAPVEIPVTTTKPGNVLWKNVSIDSKAEFMAEMTESAHQGNSTDEIITEFSKKYSIEPDSEFKIVVAKLVEEYGPEPEMEPESLKKTWEALDEDTQNQIATDIQEMSATGKDLKAITASVLEKYNIGSSEILQSLAKDIYDTVKAEKEQPASELYWKDLTIDEKNKAMWEIDDMAKQGYKSKAILGITTSNYLIKESIDLIEIIDKLVKYYEKPKQTAGEPDYVKEPWLAGDVTNEQIEESYADLPYMADVSHCFAQKMAAINSTHYDLHNYYAFNPVNFTDDTDLLIDDVKAIWTACYNEVMVGKGPEEMPLLDISEISDEDMNKIQDIINDLANSDEIDLPQASEIAADFNIKENEAYTNWFDEQWQSAMASKKEGEKTELTDWANLTESEKKIFAKSFKMWIESGKTGAEIDEILKKNNIDPSTVGPIKVIIEQYYPSEPAKMTMASLTEEQLDQIDKQAYKLWKEGQSGLITGWIEKYYYVKPTDSMQYVKELIESFEEKKNNELPAWEDLNEDNQNYIDEYIVEAIAGNITKEDILDKVVEKYNLKPSFVKLAEHINFMIKVAKPALSDAGVIKAVLVFLEGGPHTFDEIKDDIEKEHTTSKEQLTGVLKELIAAYKVTKPNNWTYELQKKPVLTKEQLKEYVIEYLTEHPKSPFSKISIWMNKKGIWQSHVLDSLVDELVIKKVIVNESGYYSLAPQKVTLTNQKIKELIMQYMGAKKHKLYYLDDIKAYIKQTGDVNSVDVKGALTELVKEEKLDKSETGDITYSLHEELPEQPKDLVVESSMDVFIQKGMSAQAVIELFSGTEGYSQGQITKKANKVFQLYEEAHPDQQVMMIHLNVLPPWVMNKVKTKASNMLMKGKTVEDTIWWLSFHFHLVKEEVAEMVKLLAKKPIEQEANLIAIATQMLEKGKKLAGCQVPASDKLEKLMPSTVAYCQGVTAPIGQEADAVIKEDGSQIKHVMKNQTIGVNTLKYDTGWQTNIGIGLASNLNFGDKLAGIIDVLTGNNFACTKTSGTSTVCEYKGIDGMSMSINQADDIRRAAIFLSMVDTVGELEKDCVPKAITYAKEHSQSINKTNKPWTVPVYPNTIYEWNKTVCEKL